MARELHLSIELDGTGHGPAAPLTDTHWTALFDLAEQGALDFVVVGGHRLAPLDAVAALVGVAPLTRRIGLVPTVAATHSEVFHTSSALATLDFASEGRAGWLVDASTNGVEAADVAEAAVRLWDRPDDDAELPAAAGFIDRERPPLVGDPSPGPRPPQGRLPIAVALDAHDSDGQWELAASHADIVFLDADQPSTARLARGALLRRAADAGRDPETLRVLTRLAVDLGSGTGPGPLPPAELRFTGTAADLAGLLADWHAATDVDGFHLLPASAPADVAAVVHDVVPALQEHALFRARYTGRTLRDHLGLSYSTGRYARDTEPVR